MNGAPGAPAVDQRVEKVRLERLTLVGPISSSVRLDMASLLADGLIAWERRAGVVDPPAVFKWQRLAKVSRENGMVFDADSYGGAGLPDSLAVRSVSVENGDADLLARLNDVLRPLVVRSGELRCYDFGALVLRLTAVCDGGGVELASDEALRWVAERSSRVASEEAGLKAWAVGTIENLRRNTPAAWLSSDDLLDGERPKGVWAPPDDGQLFWLHRIPTFSAPGLSAASGPDSLCDSAAALLNLGCPVPLLYRHAEDPVAVFPGNGQSVIVADGADSAATAQLSDTYSSVVALQTAYWTLGQELGSRILWVSNRVSLLTKEQQIGKLRKAGDRIVWLNQEFTLYQSLLSEHVARLAPDDLLRWEHLAAAWGLSGFLEQLDKRLEDFSRLAQHFLQRLQEDATSRLNDVVMVLTVVSGVSAIAALVAFATGAALRRVNGLNLTIIVIAAIALTTLVLSLTLLRVSRARQTRDGARRRRED